MLLLPQRPYIPMGTLRAAVAYPGLPDAYADADLREALAAVRLPHLADQLDAEDNWTQRLSGGEQQRLAVARALLAKPDWLFLDEATAALDEPTEEAIYRMLAGAAARHHHRLHRPSLDAHRPPRAADRHAARRGRAVHPGRPARGRAPRSRAGDPESVLRLVRQQSA